MDRKNFIKTVLYTGAAATIDDRSNKDIFMRFGCDYIYNMEKLRSQANRSPSTIIPICTPLPQVIARHAKAGNKNLTNYERFRG